MRLSVLHRWVDIAETGYKLDSSAAENERTLSGPLAAGAHKPCSIHALAKAVRLAVMILGMSSPVEIASRLPLADAPVPIGGPQLLVLDSGVIYDDIVHHLRRPGRSHVLVRSAQAGATRLLAGDHVYDEVYDRLDGHERRRVAREEVRECFERVYLPHMRFVSAPRWPVADRVLPVACADPDDVQTASLALLLAPSLVFAVDRHLVDAGFGRAEDWLRLAWQADELLGHDGTLFLTWLGLRSAVSWGFRASRRVARGIGPVEIAAGLLLSAGMYAVAPSTTRALVGHVERTGKTLGQIASYTAAGVAHVAKESGERHEALTAASVAPDPVVGVAERLARQLATRNAVMPLPQLISAAGVETDAAVAALEATPAFVFDGRGWQLGRRRLPRGRELTE